MLAHEHAEFEAGYKNIDLAQQYNMEKYVCFKN